MWSPSELAKAREARRKSSVRAVLDVSAFLAILLVLLFLFMSRLHSHDGVSMDLVRVQHAVIVAGAAREDALVVTVMRDGKIFFRSHRISPEQLPKEIQSGLREGSEKKVYLQVDRYALYSRVRVVLEQVQAAGIDDIAIITQ